MPPRPDQCVFYDPDTKRRCRRNGTGSPALCQMHRDELDEESGSMPFAEILGSVLRGKRPSQQAVEDATRTVLEGVFGRTPTVDELRQIFERARAQGAAAPPGSSSSQSSGSGARSSSAREQDQAEAEKARQVSWARRTLGYTAKEPLTKDAVKKRFRELAMKHHPDRGGSTAKMADLNRAMEILVG
jgi:hypothetical protein